MGHLQLNQRDQLMFYLGVLIVLVLLWQLRHQTHLDMLLMHPAVVIHWVLDRTLSMNHQEESPLVTV